MKRTLILIVALIAVAAMSANAAAKANYDQSPFGVNYLKWHYFNHPGGIDELRSMMKIMKNAGLYWDRDGIDLKDVHPEPGVWNWEFFDKCMALAKEEGINPIVILMGGPTPRDEKSREAYGEYVYQTVNRYKDYVKIWEIWNEPNIPSFWKNPDVKLYTELVKVAYTNAKKADPTCTVIIGSTSGPGNDWFNGIHDNGGWDYCDGLSIHPYAMASNPIEQGLDKELRVLNELVKSYGKPMKFWTTEVGWRGKSGPEEETQATRIIQTYIIHLANGIQNMAYFCMDNYDEWGFVKKTKPLEAKLAYGSVKLMTQALGSPGPCAPFEGYLKMPEGVACYVFKKNGNDRVLIMWSNDTNVRTVQLPQKNGLNAIDIINRPVVIASGKLSVGSTPIIVTGADAEKIGKVSMSFNPYLPKKGQNLLINPSMDAEPNKTPHGWSSGRFFYRDNKGELACANDGRNGSTCISIHESQKPAAWDASPIPVYPNRKYKLTAWIKTKDATGRNVVALGWYGGDQWDCLGMPGTKTLTGTNDWTKVEVEGISPKDAALVRVNLISEDNKGTVWFDDVCLTEE